MRARRTMRVPTAAQLAVGASVLAFPATALAVTKTGTANPTTVHPVVALHTAAPVAVRYGHRTVVHGTAPISTAGMAIELRYRPADARVWRVVARGHVHASGRFALTARVTRSGGLQVIPTPGASGATRLSSSPPLFSADQISGAARAQAHAATSTTTAPATSVPVPARVVPSAVRHLTVKPELALSGAHASTTALAGQPTQIHGHLLPAVPGRKVVLELQRGRHWVNAGTTRTRTGGAFTFHYVPAPTASQRLQVAFAGDRLNSHADSAPRSVTPMQYAEVSWYADGGNTACGFHATYGIASRTLPCGSKVTLSYGGRNVVATVDDRGPYVYSRLYDLDQATAGALGMDGVATVLAST